MKSPEAKSLDEIVFSGRNKVYGAYQLRRSYPTHITRALLITLVTSVGFSLFVLMYYHFQYSRMIWQAGNSKSVTAILDEDLLQPPHEQSGGRKQETALRVPEIVPSADIQDVASVSDLMPEDGSTDSTATGTGSSQGLSSGQSSGEGDGTGGEIYGTSDTYPEFPGGPKYMQLFINDNVNYPEDARSKRIKGTIQVFMVVRMDGSLTDLKVIKGLHPELDNEVLRVIASMPRWKPALRQGKPVNVRCVIPVSVAPML
jgi:protein TonB